MRKLGFRRHWPMWHVFNWNQFEESDITKSWVNFLNQVVPDKKWLQGKWMSNFYVKYATYL